MRKDIIVVGAGRVGRRVVESLDSDRQRIAVVEPNADTCQQLSTKHKRVIQGDGTAPETMDRAGLADADVVAALTDDTEINLAVCEMAREHAPDARTVLRIARDGERDYGYRSFVDSTVYPAAAGASVAVEQITSE
ncbi:TrkA-N domain protein [Natronomonas moolapensis 8.8.11]|uniref:TrkA-N domain protein n=1 Tax=Natronomonas moolapensis (strain DSM 18674 / CECT 7526 / JCM 14361 / 8.8.11) TaxID=268739 RepID=M1XSC8_NATM8|nr:NAD(P)-binding protein [Natronomonas moolapensis]CCQ37268.1 TrkA-N domain protein [Natronomonas moolapensis 8.8.11]